MSLVPERRSARHDYAGAPRPRKDRLESDDDAAEPSESDDDTESPESELHEGSSVSEVKMDTRNSAARRPLCWTGMKKNEAGLM